MAPLGPVPKRSSFLLVASTIVAVTFVAPTAVSGMDVVAQKGWRCESRPVKASITYMCSQHNSCTLNDEAALIEGELTYYGLYDIEGATNQDNLLIDAYASFNTHVGYKHRMSLLSLESFPVCGMVGQQQNKNNNNGGNSNWYNINNYYKSSSCPQDGTYPFETMFTLDTPKSRFLSWFLTGYHGEAVVDFYLERTMDLVGRCHIPMKTKPTWPIPSGMVMTTLTMVAVGVYVGYCLAKGRPLCGCCRRCGSGGTNGLRSNDKEEVLLSLPYEHEFGKTMDLARTNKGYKKEPMVDLVAW